MKTKILVPMDSIMSKSGLIRYAVRETYIKKITAYGLLPIFVSAAMPKKDIQELYAQTKGLLCMGGADIDPSFYNAKRNPRTEKGDRARDALEIELVRLAVKDRKPFLGICRGCQVLNIACGGTLIQHLPERFPNESHDEVKSYEGMLDPKSGHWLILKPGTRSAKLVKKTKTFVSSGHHQAAEKIGADLIVSGTSPAGVVELLEHRDKKYFCFGIQSHPECCEASDKKRNGLEVFFSAFAKAASAYTV